jgi:hypothetical protein
MQKNNSSWDRIFPMLQEYAERDVDSFRDVIENGGEMQEQIIAEYFGLDR